MQSIELIHGDNRKVLPTFPDNHFDALITDPPGGISFLGRGWDSDRGGRDQWVDWLTTTMQQVIRTMKPGAFGLVWAFPRTVHWTMMALEDAGFQIIRPITHHFGSGFPKTQNIARHIDKVLGTLGEPIHTGVVGPKTMFDGGQERLVYEPQSDEAKKYNDYHSDIKPATEFWVLVKKPLSEGTLAANVLRWGTGGLNVGGCRAKIGDHENNRIDKNVPKSRFFAEGKDTGVEDDRFHITPSGRFPADAAFSHSPGCTDIKCAPDCAVRQLNEQSGDYGRSSGFRPADMEYNYEGGLFGRFVGCGFGYEDDTINTSRFYYCPKAHSGEKYMYIKSEDRVIPFVDGAEMLRKRYALLDNHNMARDETNDDIIFHPTPKSIKLMRWLIRLITPPDGLILDPFAGTAATLRAAYLERHRAVGIEEYEPYYKIGFHALGQEQENPEAATTFLEMSNADNKRRK